VIRCPGCGSWAQWGAPRCPGCGAKFAPPPLGFVEQPRLTPPPRNTRPTTLITVGAVVLVLLLFLFMVAGASRTSSPAAASTTPQGALAVAPDPSPPSSGGVFVQTNQAERQPVIELANHSEMALRLELIGADGTPHDEWFEPETTRSFSLAPGQYTASIAAPYAPGIVPEEGDVRITEFHHYESDFFIGAPSDHRFYIGD
jgi:hypothetical protein